MQLSSLDQLRESLAQAMLRDQHRLRQRLRAVEQAARSGKPLDRELTALTAQIEQSVARRVERQQGLPAPTLDPHLPIAAKRDEIAAAIERHPVAIVCGETGSGKSTQLPKICLEIGRGVAGLIGHTQPRRIAARSIAARVARGAGHAARPEGRLQDSLHRRHRARRRYVKVMTDGMLLAEIAARPVLRSVRHADHRRGPRAVAEHRLPAGLPAAAAAQAARAAGDHHLGHDRRRAVQRAFRLARGAGARHRSLRPHLSRSRCSIARSQPSEDGEIDRGAAWPTPWTSWPRSTAGDVLVFLPTERDIRETAKASRPAAAGRPSGSHDRNPAALCPAFDGRAEPRLSAAQRPADRAGHERRRVVAHGAGHRYVVDTGTARDQPLFGRAARCSGCRSSRFRRPRPTSARGAAAASGRASASGCYSEEDYRQPRARSRRRKFSGRTWRR